MEIKELYHYMLEGTQEQNDAAVEVLSEVMHEIQKKFPVYYAKYDKKLENIYKHSEHHLDKDAAMVAVSKLKNNDGSIGAHWNEAAVRSVVETHPELEKLNFWDLFYTLNMVYSDYYDADYGLKDYLRLAHDFIDDKDAPKDKVKRYIKAMQESY